LVRRHRCPACRHYPEGLDRRDQSQRTAALSALLWALGLSTHATAILLQRLEVQLSAMTVWRDVLLLLWQVKGGWGRGGCAAWSEMEEGLPLAILQVDERDPKALRRALAPLLQRLGVEVLVTDDLGSYLLLARELGRLGRELGEEWAPMLARVRAILRERPEGGGTRLFRLWQGLARVQASPGAGGRQAGAGQAQGQAALGLLDDGDGLGRRLPLPPPEHDQQGGLLSQDASHSLELRGSRQQKAPTAFPGAPVTGHAYQPGAENEKGLAPFPGGPEARYRPRGLPWAPGRCRRWSGCSSCPHAARWRPPLCRAWRMASMSIW
jgi:hypothetical protein